MKRAAMLVINTLMVLVCTTLAQDVLTNEDIVKMADAKISDSIIISSIQNAQTVTFALTPTDLISLKAVGISDDVIQRMISKAASARPSMDNSGNASTVNATDLPSGVGIFYKSASGYKEVAAGSRKR